MMEYRDKIYIPKIYYAPDSDKKQYAPWCKITGYALEGICDTPAECARLCAKWNSQVIRDHLPKQITITNPNPND